MVQCQMTDVQNIGHLILTHTLNQSILIFAHKPKYSLGIHPIFQ